MDPLTTAVTTILGKYAIDKGATLIKEAGQAAANVAAKLFEKVIARLKASPDDKKNAEHFEQNPEGYKAPVADAIDEQLKSDPNFAAELKGLLEEFERARSEVIISGAVADHGGIAASTSGAATGAGGIAVSGTVGGSISVTNRETSTQDYHPTIKHQTGGVSIDADKVDTSGDMVAGDKTNVKPDE